MVAEPGDWERDKDYKRNPEAWTEYYRGPEPERKLSEPRPPQLFNIATDPGEQHDQAAHERALVEDLAVTLGAWFAEVMEEWITENKRRDA